MSQVDDVRFLAAGEYNENYVIRAGEQRYVFRLNHGSQLNLDDQIEYEFHVLKSVEHSGVTPKPCYVEPKPANLDGGVLLMEYIEGNELDYRKDRDKAAGVFSQIHALAVPHPTHLLYQRDPIGDIAHESFGLLNRHPEHPLKEEQTRLLQYHESIMKLKEANRDLFGNESLCIVNTEVNSGNFLVKGNQAFLVDWEKAVVSYRYQDLGHFLVPTSTLWKADYTYTEQEKSEFLDTYRRSLNLDISLEEVTRKTKILEETILLRALSWCFMAYYEYTQTERGLRNERTFRTIKSYLDGIETFLKQV